MARLRLRAHVPPPQPPPARLRLRGRANLPPAAAGLVTERQHPGGVEPQAEASDGVPFIRWREFIARFRWNAGEHVTIIGPTGRGKTTIALELLPMRQYVVVLATKERDDTLYPRLERAGYVTMRHFEPAADVAPRVILKPGLKAPTASARADQADAFAHALSTIYMDGGWCVYADEVRYLTDTLRLREHFELLWLQGRSLGVSMVVSTQRPVSIPLEALDQASHLFVFRETDRVNIQRLAEISGGVDTARVRELVPRLEHHEFLYVNIITGEMLRSDVRS